MNPLEIVKAMQEKDFLFYAKSSIGKNEGSGLKGKIYYSVAFSLGHINTSEFADTLDEAIEKAANTALALSGLTLHAPDKSHTAPGAGGSE
jgi:hypothetical protein